MLDEQEFKEEPLDFSHQEHLGKCPYCGEIIISEELNDSFVSENNTLSCPNCRKRLNIDELGGEI